MLNPDTSLDQRSALKRSTTLQAKRSSGPIPAAQARVRKRPRASDEPINQIQTRRGTCAFCSHDLLQHQVRRAHVGSCDPFRKYLMRLLSLYCHSGTADTIAASTCSQRGGVVCRCGSATPPPSVGRHGTARCVARCSTARANSMGRAAKSACMACAAPSIPESCTCWRRTLGSSFQLIYGCHRARRRRLGCLATACKLAQGQVMTVARWQEILSQALRWAAARGRWVARSSQSTRPRNVQRLVLLVYRCLMPAVMPRDR